MNDKTPLFPNYIFMGTTLKHVIWKTINATRGVAKAVTLDGTYRAVDAQIIEGLKYRCNNDSVLQSMDEIIEGDRVKIEKGPFANFTCQVDKIADSQRAWVLIDILQQQTKAKVSIRALTKIA